MNESTRNSLLAQCLNNARNEAHPQSNEMDDLDALCNELNEFCANNHLEQMSASELLAEYDLTQEQSDWLENFIERWEAADI